MKKSKKWISISVTIIILGFLLVLASIPFGSISKDKWTDLNIRARRLDGFYDTPESRIVSYDAENTASSFDLKILNSDIIVKISPDVTEPTLTYYEDYEGNITHANTSGAVTLVEKWKWNFYSGATQIFDRFVNKETYIITIALPEGHAVTALNLKTSNGKIDVSGVSNMTINARTSNGEIIISNVHDCQVNSLESSNGKITVKDSTNITTGNVDGMTDVETSNGDVVLENATVQGIDAESSNGRMLITSVIATGGVDIDTSNGSMVVKSVTALFFKAESSNGEITLEGADVVGDIELETFNGTIKASGISRGEQYSLDLKTFNGTVYVNDVSYEHKHNVTIGQNTIKARSSNGSIRISW